MAPTLMPRDDDIDFPGPEITSIAVIVTVSVVSLIIAAFLVACLFKRTRPHRYEQASSSNHSMSKIEQPRPPKASEYKSLNQNERQHQDRSSGSSIPREQQRIPDRLSRVSEVEEEDIGLSARSEGLRRDWKEWEAKIYHERSISLERHPGLSQPHKLSIALPPSTSSRGASPACHVPTNEFPVSPISPILPKNDNQRPQW